MSISPISIALITSLPLTINKLFLEPDEIESAITGESAKDSITTISPSLFFFSKSTANA